MVLVWWLYQEPKFDLEKKCGASKPLANGKKLMFSGTVVVKAGSVLICVEEVLASFVCQVDKMYVSQGFFVFKFTHLAGSSQFL